MSESFVSVIVPAYQSEERILKILPYFSQQDYPLDKFEVIVVDDGSTDDTQKFLDNYRSSFVLKVLRHEENRGRASACNTGIRNARGEVIVIIDDDMSFQDDFISCHVRCHAQNEQLIVVGMVRLNSRIGNTPFGINLLKRESQSIERNIAQKDNLPFYSSATGNFSIRKDTLLGVGLFDESFTVYGFEDWELGYRFKKAGVRIIYAPDAIAYHNTYVDSFSKLCKRKLLQGYSAAQFFRKHPETKDSLEIDSVFIFKGRSFEVVKKLLKSILINKTTIPFYHFLIFCSEVIFKRGSFFLYDQIGAYYYRIGIRKALLGQKL